MFTKVLVGVDGRVSGRDAIALAAQLSEPGGAITLAHVYPGVYKPSHAIVPGMAAEDRERAHALLEKEREEAGVDAELIAVQAPSPGQGLHEQAEQQDADLLVLGTCRHGIVGRAVLGNDTRAAINGAPCAIAVAPLGYAEHAKPFATIGVGYDGSPESEAALEAAKLLALRTRAEVRAREVVSIPYTGFLGPIGSGLDEMIADAERRMESLQGVRGDATYGLTGEELAELSAEVDLLIVGSRGYGPLRRVMLGSTSINLQARARGPLLILPRGTRYAAPSRTAAEDAEPAAVV
jgi:nucleotide-binding universal stress UspA family protein